jgi:hypothetical protein
MSDVAATTVQDMQELVSRKRKKFNIVDLLNTLQAFTDSMTTQLNTP